MSQFEQPLVDESRLLEYENKLIKLNQQLNNLKWVLITFLIICFAAIAVQYLITFNHYDSLQDNLLNLMHKVDKIENLLHIY